MPLVSAGMRFKVYEEHMTREGYKGVGILTRLIRKSPDFEYFELWEMQLYDNNTGQFISKYTGWISAYDKT